MELLLVPDCSSKDNPYIVCKKAFENVNVSLSHLLIFVNITGIYENRAFSVEPDQTAHRSSMISVYIVCQNVKIFRL